MFVLYCILFPLSRTFGMSIRIRTEVSELAIQSNNQTIRCPHCSNLGFACQLLSASSLFVSLGNKDCRWFGTDQIPIDGAGCRFRTDDSRLEASYFANKTQHALIIKSSWSLPCWIHKGVNLCLIAWINWIITQLVIFVKALLAVFQRTPCERPEASIATKAA